MKKKLPYHSCGLLSLALTVVVLSSCIKEDRSQCDLPVVGLSVMFIDPYSSNQPGQGLNTDEFSLVTLFFYDKYKQLIATAELYECFLYQAYELDIELSPGSYELVAWMGTETFFYNFEDTDNLEMASLNLYIPENHLIDFWISHLYFGKSSFTVDTQGKVVQMSIFQLTNDINITVEGLSKEDHYTFTIADNNGKYSFDGSFMPCETFGYQSDVLFFSGNRFESRITILRLMDGRTPMVFLTDDTTGEVLYPSYKGQDINLISLIKKAYATSSLDFDSRHIFNMSLVFDADRRVTVYVDDWQVKDDNYGL